MQFLEWHTLLITQFNFSEFAFLKDKHKKRKWLHNCAHPEYSCLLNSHVTSYQNTSSTWKQPSSPHSVSTSLIHKYENINKCFYWKTHFKGMCCQNMPWHTIFFKMWCQQTLDKIASLISHNSFLRFTNISFMQGII